MNEVTYWRKLQTKENHDFLSTQNTVQLTK